MESQKLQDVIYQCFKLLTKIDTNIQCEKCKTLAPAVTTAGTGDIPAGMKSFSIIKTSSAGTVTITMSDATTYVLTELGESFIESANEGASLPDYAVVGAGGGTFKWHGIQ